MKILSKTIARIAAAALLSMMVSACGQQQLHSSAGFPAYSAQAVSGQFVAPTIMDY